ncbi:MAG: OmpA family protein [Thermodesulfobacteriota bacterium]|nr:OmpA family protein [Thermodesulfobacteriota bacterium]
MLKKSSVWLVVLISIMSIAFIATGCAKKQVVKEEATAKPVVEAKKEEPKPAPAPRVEAAPPAPAPRVEAAPPAPAPPAPAPRVEAAPPAPAPEPVDLVSLRIQFAFDDYSLSTKAKENLEKLAAWMSKNPKEKMQIEGHTCDIGTNEYNLALGERRANSAKKYLEALGVGSAKISTISYGEERPLVPNKEEAERSKNRRDDFVKTR